MTTTPSPDLAGLLARVEAFADRVHRRAEIMRQFADQQTGEYRPVADADADQEEQLSADLRTLILIAANPTVEETGR